MKLVKCLIFPILILLILNSCFDRGLQNESDYLNKPWKELASQMPIEWYASKEAKMVADSILKYQTKAGGWAKNVDFHCGGLKPDEWERIQSSGVGATFDNGATITEMKFLAKMFGQQKDERYKNAFYKALDYIFEAQYENGGWPQFYPYRKGKSDYSAHITYNDNAMINVMNLLKDVANGVGLYEPLKISEKIKIKSQEAFDSGVDCILKTQIQVNGERTVWCAQHDAITFAPAKARSYELESFSGQESVDIVLLLMGVKNPSDEIIAAVKGAVKWFDQHRISGIRVERFLNTEGKSDKVVVQDSTASDLWGRFHDLETGKIFFCDRDGIKKNSLSEIGIDRRGNYRWYTPYPQKVLDSYPEWVKKWNIKKGKHGFSTGANGSFGFDTGIIKGVLRNQGKSHGLALLKFNTDSIYLTRREGIFNHYRVFANGKRFSKDARNWTSSAQMLPDGSVEVKWESTDSRPFAITAVYSIVSSNTIDLKTYVGTNVFMKDFEIFLASYFSNGYTESKMFVNIGADSSKYQNKFISADRDIAEWHAYSRDQRATDLINDGRWKLEPSPIEWTVLSNFALPLVYRRNPESGKTIVLMTKNEDCFGIFSPYAEEKHYSSYFSLFGFDIEPDIEVTAHSRVVFLEDSTEEEILRVAFEFFSE